MLSFERIEETLESLLDTDFADRFSFPESELADCAIHALNARAKEDQDRIRAEASLILRAQENVFVSEGTVYPKAQFFKDMRFRVVPTQAEIEKAVLIPAAAFVPFCTDEIFCDEFTMTDSDGVPCPVIEIKTRFADAAGAFTMLGRSGTIDHLSAESEENRLAIRAAQSLESVTVSLTAFDLSAFYRKHEFQDGDALIITIKDWEKGIFSVSCVKAKDTPSENDREVFLRDFERALVRVCRTEKDYIDIPLQIAEAYLFAYEDGHDLRDRPVLSLEEYRLRMSEIAIRRDGSEWLLVPADDLDTPGQFEQSLLKARQDHDESIREHECSCGHEHGHEHNECSCGHDHGKKPERTLDPDLSPDNFTISEGSLDSIDSILAELNAPVNSIELTAMIFDAIANGDERFEDFRSRTMDFLDLKFVDDAQETAFINFLEDNWEICNEYFNPNQDTDRAPLRTRLLDLTNQRIEFSMRLLERLKGAAAPKDLVSKLTAIHQGILDTLSLLNTDTPIDGDGQYDQLELRVGDLEDAWDDFMERAESLFQ